jgi:hypothetical protein
MNNTQKILLAGLVGGGLAYLWNKSRKKPYVDTTPSYKPMPLGTGLVDDSELTTRDEKVNYIIDNAEANFKEEMSGFAGVSFQWNPVLNKMYPVGTIVEGVEPQYIDDVFYGAEGQSDDPSAEAESIVESMTDDEIDLAYRLTKYRLNNPSAISEEQAMKELSGNNFNENVLILVKQKIKPKLNDVKALKKHPVFAQKWALRKEKRKGKKDERAKGKQGKAMSSKPKTKALWNRKRQKDFAKQFTNPTEGAMFGGKRWDGQTDDQLETQVRLGQLPT